jgi:hypothetical protein
MLGVESEQSILTEQVAAADVALAWDRHRVVLDADDEIDGPRPQVVQSRRPLVLHDLDMEVGSDLREPVEHTWRQRERASLHERHPQGPAGHP